MRQVDPNRETASRTIEDAERAPTPLGESLSTVWQRHRSSSGDLMFEGINVVSIAVSDLGSRKVLMPLCVSALLRHRPVTHMCSGRTVAVCTSARRDHSPANHQRSQCGSTRHEACRGELTVLAGNRQ